MSHQKFNSAQSLNSAMEFSKLKRDSHKGTAKLKSERYYVTARDDKGQEYVIRYFF